jgi:(R,R)-butanediol dehydrogenase/meso-butanediol dehydrogenase/diacetyl reductase
MRAAVLHGEGDLRLEDVAERAPSPGDVAIDVVHNGLCGSDLKLFQMGLRAVSEPHPTTGHCGPQILGHEFSGTVVSAGADAAGVRVGDRVCVEPLYPCMACSPCSRGLVHLCQILTFHGVVSSGGGLSERTVVPASMVHVLPASLSFEQGALIEPMSVSYHAVGRATVAPGDIAVVFGAGPIGIGVLLTLHARGIGDVVVVEPSPVRRSAVARLGGIAVAPDELSSHLSARAPRHGGADVAFDCAGVSSSFAATVGVLRARGQAVVVAGSSAYPLTTTAHLLQHTEITITGSLAFQPGDFDAVIALMATGAYPTAGWVEHIAFDDILQSGFHDLIAGRRTKVLVDIT